MRDPAPAHGLTPEQHEAVRKKIALEMKADPEMKLKVESIVGEEQARQNYPEAYK